MKLTRIIAAVTVAGALGVGSIGVANAAPGAPLPEKPGCGRDHDCGPGPGWPGPGPDGPGRGPGGPGPHNDNWNAGRDFSVGSVDWWRGRPGKHWRDGDLPPWGFWGPPPAYQWSGPPPWVNQGPINYWGYQATPVWDDGFHGWGIWLFGVWIPIVGISAY